jgi:hypothetical protein
MHYVSIFVNYFLSVFNKAEIILMLIYNKFLFLSNELRYNCNLLLFCLSSCCFKNMPHEIEYNNLKQQDDKQNNNRLQLYLNSFDRNKNLL